MLKPNIFPYLVFASLIFFLVVPALAQNPDSIPFAPAVNYGVGDLPRSVFCADLDGDGDLDLAVANAWSGSVSILKNLGDGTFKGAVTYWTGGAPYSVFCADLDGDSDLDLAVANAYGANVSILKNIGDGNFESAVDYGVGDEPFSVFCADLDGDDDLDLAVANLVSYDVSILKNNGDGTFQSAVNYGVGPHPWSIFCADLDGDMDLDLAVANRFNGVSILKNRGDGTFENAVNYGAGNEPVSVFCADLDGDIDLDLAVANLGGGNISILNNNGNGTFQSAVNYGVGDEPFSVFCADLNGDNDLDLSVANSQDNVSILRNSGGGTFQSAVNYVAGGCPLSVFCADLDGDTDLDLAVANGCTDNVSILKNLTQIPGNSPPYPFHLFSPIDGDSSANIVDFDWASTYDPNLGDQIKYDLSVSTSIQFVPESTIVDSNLQRSNHTDTLPLGNYYWKVKAKDNWGAERWSTQTWSFTIVPTTTLVGYWKFDEGSGTTAHDSSGNENDGTLMNGPTWVDGLPVLGKALEFDGTNDYVAIPDLYSSSPSALTVSLWINSTLPSQHSEAVHHFRNGEFGIGIESSGGIGFGVKLTNGLWYSVESPTTPNVWHHLVGVWEMADSVKLYIDGVAVAQMATPNLYLWNWEGSASIGSYGGSSMFFPGRIDHVKVYSHALSPEEIKAEFEVGFAHGDANADGKISVSDVVYLINYLFKGGPFPQPQLAGDANCDGNVTVSDVVYLINYLFKGGPPPC